MTTKYGWASPCSGGINAREGAIEAIDELRNQVDPYTDSAGVYMTAQGPRTSEMPR